MERQRKVNTVDPPDIRIHLCSITQMGMNHTEQSKNMVSVPRPSLCYMFIVTNSDTLQVSRFLLDYHYPTSVYISEI